MRKINALILDDEESAVQNLKIIIEQFCPEINIIQAETDAIKIISMINLRDDIDVLFVDIEMGKLNGFDVLELISSKCVKIVFVTAYSEYALKAIEFQPFGYILKPIDIDKLIEIYEKLKNVIGDISEDSSIEKIRIPIAEGFVWVEMKNILYIKADRSYCTLFLDTGKNIVLSKSMSWLVKHIDSNKMFKCQKSYTINIDQIDRYLHKDGGFVLLKDESLVPVGKNNKDLLFELM